MKLEQLPLNHLKALHLHKFGVEFAPSGEYGTRQELLQLLSTPRGLGDTIANLTHATGLDKLAEAYTRITGKPCGCASRQEALNKLVPYKNLPTK